MIDTAQPHADHQNHRQAQMHGEIGAVAVGAQRHAKSPGTFNQHPVRLTTRIFCGVGDDGKVDLDAGLGSGDMRGDRWRKTIRVEDFRRQVEGIAGTDCGYVLVAATGIGAGGDRLQADCAQAVLACAPEQGAGDVGLADFGVGSGDEIRGCQAAVVRLGHGVR